MDLPFASGVGYNHFAIVQESAMPKVRINILVLQLVIALAMISAANAQPAQHASREVARPLPLSAVRLTGGP